MPRKHYHLIYSAWSDGTGVQTDISTHTSMRAAKAAMREYLKDIPANRVAYGKPATQYVRFTDDTYVQVENACTLDYCTITGKA